MRIYELHYSISRRAGRRVTIACTVSRFGHFSANMPVLQLVPPGSSDPTIWVVAA